MLDCLPEAELRQFFQGQMSDVESERVEAHAKSCPICSKKLEEFTFYPQPHAEGIGKLPMEAGASASTAPAGVSRRAFPTIPGFEFLGQLGEGGMGVVYLARQESLNRLVALKTLSAGRASDGEARERFRREAEAAAKLRHPNIVAIHGVSEYDGWPYFIMDYIKGMTLAKLVRESPLPSRRAASLLMTVANAVQHAHEAGVLHRDLKPSNILLDCGNRLPVTDQARPMVTDFGLAKLTSAGGGPASTGTGQALGTPSYMPPEQVLNEGIIGPTSDVYALGATLYELLTGRPPFQAETALETLQQVLEVEPAAPRVLNRDVPRDLETICLKCLRKNPRKRYGSARELAEDLARYLAGKPILARPVAVWEHMLKWGLRHPAAAALCIVLLIAMLAGCWLEVDRRDAQNHLALQDARLQIDDLERQAQEVALRAEKAQQTTSRYHALVSQVAEAIANPRLGWPFQALVALGEAASSPSNARNALQLRRLAAACLSGVGFSPRDEFARGITGHCLAFSPEGRHLAIGQAKGLRCSVALVDLAHQTSRVLSWLSFHRMSQTGVRALAFSPDGRWLVAGLRGGEVYRWDTLEAALRPALLGTHQGEVSGLAFRPDGQLLVSCSGDGTLGRWAVAGWRHLASISMGGSLTRVAFSPNGKMLACCGSTGLRFFDTASLLSGSSIPLKPFAAWNGHHGTICFTPDGRWLVAFTNGRVQLYRVWPHDITKDRSTREWRLDAADGEVMQIGFHPSGALFAVGTNHQIVKVFELGSGHRVATIVLGGNANTYPAFSPDGRSLAVTCEQRTVVFVVAGLQQQTWSAQQEYPLNAFTFLPAGGLACIATAELPLKGLRQGELTLWEPEGRCAAVQGLNGSLPEAQGVGRIVACHLEQSIIAYSGDSGRRFRLWDPRRGTITDVPHAPTIVALCFGRAGSWLWAAGDPARIACWSWPGLQPGPEWRNTLADTIGSRSSITSVAAGRQWTVVGSADSTTKLFRLANAHRLVQQTEWISPQLKQVGKDETALERIATALNPDKGSNPILCVALNRDETLAASGTASGAVQVASIPTGAKFGDVLRGHEEGVRSVAFSPNGLYLATGSQDRTVRLWRRDTSGYHEAITLPTPGPVIQVQFSADGRQLGVLVQDEYAVRVWHMDRLLQSLRKLKLGW